MRFPSELNCHIIRPMSAPSSVVASPPNTLITAFGDMPRRAAAPPAGAEPAADPAKPAELPVPVSQAREPSGVGCSAGSVMAAVVSTGLGIGPIS